MLANLPVQELLDRFPQAIPVLIRRQMVCVGCQMAMFDTLADAARIYHLDLDDLLAEIRITDSPDSTDVLGNAWTAVESGNPWQSVI